MVSNRALYTNCIAPAAAVGPGGGRRRRGGREGRGGERGNVILDKFFTDKEKIKMRDNPKNTKIRLVGYNGF